MDVGFSNAGIEVLWANDIDQDACRTYTANNEGKVTCGDLCEHLQELDCFKSVDIVFGGPPCQGFSVAGKMDPDDPRSQLLWDFLSVVKICRPKIFVCENVKALGVLQKWSEIRQRFLTLAHRLGYDCDFLVLNAKDFGVPQRRERVFFIASQNGNIGDLGSRFESYKRPAPTVREIIYPLGKAGTKQNNRVCNAKITLAANPVMRKSPYAGMLFNGLGRPLRLEGHSATLPASMGGNKTPIVDEEELFLGKSSWVEAYHNNLQCGKIQPVYEEAPERLRRLTIDEALRIQTFPEKYIFKGRNSSIYKQIGNAVPCGLAQAVALVAIDILKGKMATAEVESNGQIQLPV